MNQKNALTSIIAFPNHTKLKRLLLFFDKVYIHEDDIAQLRKEISRKDSNPPDFLTQMKSCLNEYNYLLDKGLLLTYKDPKLKNRDFETAPLDIIENVFSTVSRVRDFQKKGLEPQSDSDYMEQWVNAHDDFTTHCGCLSLHQKGISNVYPIISSTASSGIYAKKSDVLNFVINRMPFPKDDVPWEDIENFRNDEDVQTSYLNLINWINQTSILQKQIGDISDEFTFLYNQYMRHYNIHRIKSQMGIMELFISIGLEAVSNMAPMNMIKELFALRKTKLSLAEEKLKLPGKEVAYILKVQEKFQ